MRYSHYVFLFYTLTVSIFLLSACVLNEVPDAAVLPELSAEEAAAVEAEAAAAGLTVEQALTLASLQDSGLAPELTNDTWLNSEPLRLADLRGKVVLIEFWTYG